MHSQQESKSWSEQGSSREGVEEVVGLEKIIWLPGIRGKDITDDHVDFYVKFVKPGQIVVAWEDDTTSWDYQVTRDHYGIIKEATDARGRKLEITRLPIPNYNLIRRKDSVTVAAGYVN